MDMVLLGDHLWRWAHRPPAVNRTLIRHLSLLGEDSEQQAAEKLPSIQSVDKLIIA